MKPTFGLEEEVFVLEPTKPSIQSLYYLSKLVWKHPKAYLKHTDSNFSRKKDIFQGLMSGVEISTLIHTDSHSLIDDLRQRRRQLTEVSEGLIVAMGHLFDYEASTNTCALQFHIGNLENPEKTYANLVYFLPLLFLISANAPAASKRYFGKSWRLLNSYGVGPLTQDWKHRFQDIIFAKRTRTLELRVFDPVWDIKRIKLLAQLIEAVVSLDKKYELDIDRYNKLRQEVAIHGYGPQIQKLYKELRSVFGVEEYWFKVTPADIVWKHYIKHGLEATYSALDYGYRYNKLKVCQIPKTKKNPLKMAAGLATYYIPKLPYDLWKFIREK